MCSFLNYVTSHVKSAHALEKLNKLRYVLELQNWFPWSCTPVTGSETLAICSTAWRNKEDLKIQPHIPSLFSDYKTWSPNSSAPPPPPPPPPVFVF